MTVVNGKYYTPEEAKELLEKEEKRRKKQKLEAYQRAGISMPVVQREGESKEQAVQRSASKTAQLASEVNSGKDVEVVVTDKRIPSKDEVRSSERQRFEEQVKSSGVTSAGQILNNYDIYPTYRSPNPKYDVFVAGATAKEGKLTGRGSQTIKDKGGYSAGLYQREVKQNVRSDNKLGNNSRDGSTVYLESNKVQQQNKREERIKEITDRNKRFREEELAGYERTKATANLLFPNIKTKRVTDAFGVTKNVFAGFDFETPAEQKSPAQRIGIQLASIPLNIVPTFYNLGYKGGAVGQGLAYPELKEATVSELGRVARTTPIEVVKSLNPTTPEGFANLAVAISGVSSGGKGSFIEKTNPGKFENIKLTVEIQAPQVKSYSDSIIFNEAPQVKIIGGGEIINTRQVNVNTIGVGYGTKGQPLVTYGSEGFKLGTPNFGDRIPISSIQEGQGVAQPITGVGAKTFDALLKLSPEEQTRVKSLTRAGAILKSDKGLKVTDADIKIEGIKNSATATKIVFEEVKSGEGVLFGSATTNQLPKGFRTLTPGDIDVIFPKLKVEEIKPVVEKITSRLQASGELVEVSPRSDNVIQFSKQSPKFGEKFAEFKSGINQEILGLGDEAPVGVRGIIFSNLKAGRIGSTVPFEGQGVGLRAITAGEQFTRKVAGSTIVSPGKLPGETPSFSEAGILGKQGNPRGLKDVAGSFQSGLGLTKIRESSINPIKRLRGKVAEAELNKAFGSYTKSQQIDIQSKLKATTGNELIFANEGFAVSFIKEPISSPSGVSSFVGSNFRSSTGGRINVSELSKPTSFSGDVISQARDLSFSLSPRSPQIKSGSLSFISVSPRVESPSVVSVSKSSSSSSRSPSVSAFSPSVSPIGSPSISPLSPSPSAFKSPSPSPSPSLSKSPSPSIFSPSPYSPKSPGSPYTFIPSNIPDKPILKIPKQNEGNKFFDVFVRKSGVFRKLNTNTLELKEAIDLGKTRVSQTSARTFKILNRRTGKLVKPTGLGQQFRYSKKNPFLAVEKSKYAINNPIEVKEISLKGLETQRRFRI